MKPGGICHIILILSALCLVASKGYGQIEFERANESLGVSHQMTGNTIGSGVTIYDFNQDGLDDLTLGTYAGQQIGFYVNNGNGFDQIDPLVDNLEIVKQINWVDYDNDGDPDLYVAANEGVSRLYENLGDLTFEDVTASAGLPENFHYGYGACWGDYNRDGWLDLYYASKGIIGNPDAIRSYNRLFKNNADGTFVERTFEADVSDDGKLPFCAAFLDYNNDMWPDIYIANDKLTFNTLLRNNANGTYTDVSRATGANARMNAMCVNPGDYNHDGWMDIYVTNTPVGSQFLRNTGERDVDGFIQFFNVANTLNIHFPGGNCWGSNFFDVENDGDLDLYVSSSIPKPKSVSSAFFENINGNSFTIPEVTGFAADTAMSYANAIGDLNQDGLVDLVVQNNPPEPFYLWLNRSEPSNHWLKIDLIGVMSNREGVGVKLESYNGPIKQLQFTLCGSGFLGQNSSYKHIGLGEEDHLDSLVVTWPTGHVDKFYNLPANQTIEITEGSSTGGEIDIAPGVNIVEKKITTSVSDLEENLIRILNFPNPGSQYLQLESEKKIESARVIDMKGVIWKNEIIGRNAAQLDLNDLAPGIFMIQVQFTDKQHYSFKWVKSE